jgi:hypothetical protein
MAISSENRLLLDSGFDVTKLEEQPLRTDWTCNNRLVRHLPQRSFNRVRKAYEPEWDRCREEFLSLQRAGKKSP